MNYSTEEIIVSAMKGVEEAYKIKDMDYAVDIREVGAIENNV